MLTSLAATDLPSSLDSIVPMIEAFISEHGKATIIFIIVFFVLVGIGSKRR